MKNYRTKFEAKVIKKYWNGGIGCVQPVKKYDVPSEGIVRRRINTYKNQDCDRLKISRKNHKYALDFKLKVVN